MVNANPFRMSAMSTPPENVGTRYYADRCRREQIERNEAIKALTDGVSMVYAVEIDGDLIKIGVTKRFYDRRRQVGGRDVLALMPGGFDAERAIHASLADYRHHGREYYHRTPEVIEVINEMREYFALPPLTA